jgi:hypothetical protein
MSEVKELPKFIIHFSLVFCPKSKRIVETNIACLSCPYRVSEDWDKVCCSYVEGEKQ